MTNRMHFPGRGARRALKVFSFLCLISVGRESRGQTVNLTVSDRLRSGVIYATVTLNQSGPNTVSFSVVANPNVYSPPANGANFGIASFGFESRVALASDGSDITFDSPTTSWSEKTPGGSITDCGTFDWVLQADYGATSGAGTLNFHVTHTGITPSTFTSKVNSQNADFAATIIDFPKTSGYTSQAVANTGAHVQHFLVKFFVAGAGIVLGLLVLFLLVWKWWKGKRLSREEIPAA
jgi:hypothetical protein